MHPEKRKKLMTFGSNFKEILKDLGIPIVSDYFALTNRPLLALACNVATGGWTAVDAIAQKKLNDFVLLLQEGKIDKEDLQTEEFRSALERTYDYWMDEKNEKKRKIMRQIFLGFINSSDRSQFRIERMYRALDSLELEDIIALSRVNELLLEKQIETYKEEYEKNRKEYEDQGKSFEKYLAEKANAGFGFRQPLANQIVNGLSEGMDNLERLGIIKLRTTTANTFNGGADVTYWLTTFGFQFSQFIQEQDIA